MLRAVFLITLAALSTRLPCEAMQIPPANDIDDLPAYYTYWAKISWDSYPAFVSLDWCDCKIFDIMSKNALKILQNAWSIHDVRFGPQKSPLIDAASGKYLWNCIELYKRDDICSPEELKEVYVKIFEILKDGWNLSVIEDYPDIMFKQPEKTWFLFVKKQRLVEEDSLIRFLAEKFNLATKVDSMCEWLKKGSGVEDRAMPYLWIKKDALAEVQSKLKICLRRPKRADSDQKEHEKSEAKRPRGAIPSGPS